MFILISDINISLSYKVIKSFYNKRFFVNRQADNCPEKFPLDSTQALYTGWQCILMYVIHFFSQYVIDSQSLLFLINYYTAISWAKYSMCFDFFSSFYHLYIFSIAPYVLMHIYVICVSIFITH